MPADVVLNGEPRPLAGRTVADVLPELGLDPEARGHAVAVDGEVLPRASWADVVLAPGARVEVVSAMQGG